MVDAPEESYRSTEVVVVGAGQAGLSLSFHLTARAIPHVVLERDRPFASWFNRWDGFRTNTPNWMNSLPMLPNVVPSGDPEGFATREELLDYLVSCLAEFDAPIETGREVRRVIETGTNQWMVETGDVVFQSSAVAICNGAMSKPSLPPAQTEIPSGVPQFHSSAYRDPGQVATGSVLVVGSASSGVQICRLLCESGRFKEVSMAVSRVMVLPDRILGVPTHRFIHRLGLFDLKSRSLLGRLMYSGLETKGDPIMRPAPRDLARLHGVNLHARFVGVEEGALVFADGRTMATDDLTIIWCTGFQGDYDLLELTRPDLAFNSHGYPVHNRGVVGAAPGLYFVGLRYQHTVASHDIYGVGVDAQFVADRISEAAGSRL